MIYNVEIEYISCEDNQAYIGTCEKKVTDGVTDYWFNTPEEGGTAWIFDSEEELEDFVMEQCEGSYVEALKIVDNLEEGLKCLKES